MIHPSRVGINDERFSQIQLISRFDVVGFQPPFLYKLG